MNKLKQWFSTLTPDRQRRFIVFSVLSLLILAIVIAVLATENGDAPRPASNKKKKLETSILTGKDPNKVGIEQLLASQKRAESELEDLKRQMIGLKNQVGGTTGKDAKSGNALPYPYNQSANGDQVALPGDRPQSLALPNGGGSVSAPAVASVSAPEKAVAEALGAAPPSTGKPGRGNAASRSAELPPPNIPGMPSANGAAPGLDPFSDAPAVPIADAPVPPPPPPAKPTLRVLQPRQDFKQSVSDTTPNSNSTYTNMPASPGRNQGRNANRDPEFYLPMGSILSGTLLTGVDAPASGQHARKDPFPALLRVKHEAILPNNGLLDIRDCLLIASAYSDLSSERVYMRAEGLSCQRGDGAIIEATIDAYASGSDGKAGIHGRVVEKTGQLVARSLVAGFVGGLAEAFKPQKSQAVSVNPAAGTTGTFQYPDPSYVVGTGLLGGASEAATRIGSIYDELAKQIVPVIEVNAGIPLDFIMTRGVTLRFKKVGEVSGATARGGNAGQQGRPDQATTSLTGAVGGGFSVTPGTGTSTPAPAPTGPSKEFQSQPRR
jgi:conjugal transfer pilus assembly protein TraB